MRTPTEEEAITEDSVLNEIIMLLLTSNCQIDIYWVQNYIHDSHLQWW